MAGGESLWQVCEKGLEGKQVLFGKADRATCPVIHCNVLPRAATHTATSIPWRHHVCLKGRVKTREEIRRAGDESWGNCFTNPDWTSFEKSGNGRCHLG